MRILIDDLLEGTLIKRSYFLKFLLQCGVSNRIYLDEFDLIRLHNVMPVKTYKTQQLYEKITELISAKV